MHTTQDDIQPVTVTVPVDTQLSKGFVVSAILHLLIYFFVIAWIANDPVKPARTQLPMELIRLGLGNGPGSGGNLSPAGAAQKGPAAENPLEDASRRQQTRQQVKPPDQYTPNARVVGAPVTTAQRSRDSSNARGQKTTGAANGSATGTGLGSSGTGPGSGLGFGIDWGGGGNRRVLNKVIPDYPTGVNKNAKIRIRFGVKPDGAVGFMVPLIKGDPRMESAAMKALQQWRFDPLPAQSNQQVGEITFSFKMD